MNLDGRGTLAAALTSVAVVASLYGSGWSDPPGANAAGPEIQLYVPKDGSQAYQIRVVGLSKDVLQALASTRNGHGLRTDVLALFTSGNEATPMLGKLHLKVDVLTFVPRFPLKPGLEYRAVFDPSRLALGETRRGRIETHLKVPDLPPSPRTTVEKVFPTSDELPENQLRFYVHFSAAMSRGNSYRHIRLVNGQGQTIFRPFLELGEELWDPSGRRFTLLVDPGRIKRGLKPREEFGPVFESGESYILHIDAAWRDATGRPLCESFRKRFMVGPPDDVQPDPNRWQITFPAAGSTEPLLVVFAEPLDHAMLHRVLHVVDQSGELATGTIGVDQYETRWTFRPDSVWQPAHYKLVVDTALEDRAGNNIRRPFEVSIGGDDASRHIGRTVQLEFEVR